MLPNYTNKYWDERRDSIKVVLGYAEMKYGLNFSEREKLIERLLLISTGINIPEKEVVDGIMKEWDFWKPYLAEESFKRFFLYELKSMFRIHACATSSSTELNSYVGNKAKVVKELPKASTTISLKGEFCVMI